MARSLKEIDQSKLLYDKGKINRTLEVGQQVMSRISGMSKKLQDAREGSFRDIAYSI